MANEITPASYQFYDVASSQGLEEYHQCLTDYLRKLRKVNRVCPSGPPIPLSLFDSPGAMDLIQLVASKSERAALIAWYNAFHSLRDYALINMPSFRTAEEVAAAAEAELEAEHTPVRMDEDEEKTPSPSKPKSKGSKRARVGK